MRPMLSENQISENVKNKVESYHVDVVKDLAAKVQKNKYVIVGMKHNPFVMKARKAMKEQNLPFEYIEYGSYFSQWKPRLAIKMWSGWPTFPQVFVNGKLIGGCDDLKAMIASNQLPK